MVVSAQPDAKKSFRVDQDGKLREKWVKMLADRKISQTDAIESLFQWIVAQDETVQAMVLGQISPAPDLVLIVLRRLLEQSGQQMPPGFDLGDFAVAAASAFKSKPPEGKRPSRRQGQ